MTGFGLKSAIQEHRPGRFPLKRLLVAPSGQGIVGGAIVLILLRLALMVVNWRPTSKGIYVGLSAHGCTVARAIEGQIIVQIRSDGSAVRLLLNGNPVNRETLPDQLRAALSTRPDWLVYVEADPNLTVAEPMYVVGVINDLHAKPVLLTEHSAKDDCRY